MRERKFYRVAIITLSKIRYTRGSRSLTPSKAALRAAFTAASVALGLRVPPSADCFSVLSFSLAISYASAAFSRVSNTPI